MPRARLSSILAVWLVAGCVEPDASLCDGADDCLAGHLCVNGVCEAWPGADPVDERVRDAVEIDQPWPDAERARVDAALADEGPYDRPCASDDRTMTPGHFRDHSDADAPGWPDQGAVEGDARWPDDVDLGDDRVDGGPGSADAQGDTSSL